MTWLDLSILLKERKDGKLFIEGLSRNPLEPETLITNSGYGDGVLQVVKEIKRRDAKGKYNPPELAKNLWFRAEVRVIGALGAHNLAPEYFKKPEKKAK